MKIILFFLLLATLTTPCFAAKELPLHQQKLSKDYFTCKVDSDCTTVSGWCTYFTINKNMLDSFKKIPKDKENTCPPGWVPKREIKPACLNFACRSYE